MKKWLVYSVVTIAVTCSLFSACKPDPDVNAIKVEEFGFIQPKDWPAAHYNFENNTLTKDGFELGRKLFFDPRLSRDNTISCGTCHLPSAAFAHPDHDVSHGIEDKLGNRNSPALFNINWHTSFFWDGGVNHIEVQPISPIQNPVEMDEKLDNITAKLSADAKYKSMFKSAFGDEAITSQRMLKALAQFMGMLVSSNSRYDKYVRNEVGGDMSASELSGLGIYNAKCASCHKAPLFTDYSFRNNGLPVTAANDSGRGRITLLASDMRKFKVPSLRNLKYTFPYMHDGRFSTLDKVLDHYATGVVVSPTLDPLLQTGIQLNAQERTDLLAFLNTLNDEVFVNDNRFKEVK